MKLTRLFALACTLLLAALPSAFAELKEGRDYRLVMIELGIHEADLLVTWNHDSAVDGQ